MKTLKLISFTILVCSFSVFAQTPPAQLNPTVKQAGDKIQGQQGWQPTAAGQAPAKLNRYMVEIPHTKEQCANVAAQMKAMGPIGMRFDWGCASGEHIGFALMPGVSEDAVRKQLPEGLQAMAKIIKVDRANSMQMQTPKPDLKK